MTNYYHTHNLVFIFNIIILVINSISYPQPQIHTHTHLKKKKKKKKKTDILLVSCHYFTDYLVNDCVPHVNAQHVIFWPFQSNKHNKLQPIISIKYSSIKQARTSGWGKLSWQMIKYVFSVTQSKKNDSKRAQGTLGQNISIFFIYYYCTLPSVVSSNRANHPLKKHLIH